MSRPGFDLRCFTVPKELTTGSNPLRIHSQEGDGKRERDEGKKEKLKIETAISSHTDESYNIELKK